MEQTFLTDINIEQVRHLSNIYIPLSENTRKHLILTGKNGSGKTSVLDAVVKYVQAAFCEDGTTLEEAKRLYKQYFEEVQKINSLEDTEQNRKKLLEATKYLDFWEKAWKKRDFGAILHSNSDAMLKRKFDQGKFLFAYYKAEREFQVEKYTNIEKVELKNKYTVKENPGGKLTKYLVNLKATQAFTKDVAKREKIIQWFFAFENILRLIFEDENLKLQFDDETFQFSIIASGKEQFDFNTMSSGYSAVFDIINDLIVRMEAQSELRTEFDMEGVVFVDEIETHLHLELQKKILPILVTLFPNIQFIITTHSPFVLNSLENAVIYDLENRTLVENGLGNLPYEGIVEGYFKADTLSDTLRAKFERYVELVSKSVLSDEEYEEIDKLEFYLDEIPDYLAKELTSEYSRLKLEFSNRGEGQ